MTIEFGLFKIRCVFAFGEPIVKCCILMIAVALSGTPIYSNVYQRDSNRQRCELGIAVVTWATYHHDF